MEENTSILFLYFIINVIVYIYLFMKSPGPTNRCYILREGLDMFEKIQSNNTVKKRKKYRSKSPWKWFISWHWDNETCQ